MWFNGVSRWIKPGGRYRMVYRDKNQFILYLFLLLLNATFCVQHKNNNNNNNPGIYKKLLFTTVNMVSAGFFFFPFFFFCKNNFLSKRNLKKKNPPLSFDRNMISYPLYSCYYYYLCVDRDHLRSGWNLYVRQSRDSAP